MAALTAVTPTRAGTVIAAGNVSSSDTIAGTLLGTKGALLEIINGNASPDSITISDFGSTASGGQLPSNNFSASVTNGTNKVFLILPSQGDPANGNQVTVTHTTTTTVTYKLYSLG